MSRQNLSLRCSLNIAILAVFALLLTYGLSFSLPSLYPHSGVFGWEYGNIAQNLVEGRGYSGPFGVSSIPTAWMPPLLPLFVATVFLLLGVKTTLSATALLVSQAIMSWLGLLFLLRLDLKSGHKILLSLLYSFYAYLNWGPLLFEFHDTGLILALSTLTLLSLKQLREEKAALAFTTALLLPLASPSLAIAFGILVILGRIERRLAQKVLGVMFLSAGLWCLRNAVVLGAFVPLKSNLFFELHQANVCDNDGVPQSSTFVLHHPIVGFTEEKALYEKMGEMDFLAFYKTRFIRFLPEEPGTYGKKLLARSVNAFIYLKAPSDLLWDYNTYPEELMNKLVARRLIGPNRPPVVWCSLWLSRAQFLKEIHGLDKNDQETVLTGWDRAVEKMKKRNYAWNWVVWGLLHGLLTTLAIILGLKDAQLRKEPYFRDASILYVIYLLPYVVISHYMRYQVPLMGLSALLLSSALLGRKSSLELGEKKIG